MEIEKNTAGAEPAVPRLPETYRAYLQQLFDSKQRINPRFSQRRFAEIVGFKSPNYLKLILEGSRSLSLAMGGQICDRLKILPPQRDYFLSLIEGELAVTDQEKSQAERNRLAAFKKIVSKEIPQAQQQVLSEWYHLLIRELFLMPGARPSPEWIASMLGDCVTAEEAERSLEVLVQSGFLKPLGDSFAVTDPVLRTNEENLQAVFMRQHHAQLLKIWSRNLDRLGPQDQELGVLNIPLNSSKIPELRHRIRQFQDEIVGWVQSETEADCLVQLGTYLIPYPKREPQVR